MIIPPGIDTISISISVRRIITKLGRLWCKLQQANSSHAQNVGTLVWCQETYGRGTFHSTYDSQKVSFSENECLS